MGKYQEVRSGVIVRVIDGPFAGHQGEVKEVGERSVKVAVQVYGRDTPVDLTYRQIELVPKNLN